MLTMVSGIINVSLNLWLVPTYGIMASAWATFIAYLTKLIMVWYVSGKVYQLDYEYKRIGLALGAGCALFAMSFMIPSSTLFITILLKATLIALYPPLLYLLGFFSQAEKRKFIEMIKAAKSRL